MGVIFNFPAKKNSTTPAQIHPSKAGLAAVFSGQITNGSHYNAA